ncbi:YcaO-like family protein [Chondromyces crocatus]|uniref:YcaO domain-containing protein n=1 Tax=Chondromyces crocatus TaxID=52 RepID=A0A0K1EF39_CHOCO|nr:YcaO-like family protein [Chondromyces crocatus]AKT39183.1 uncharacterized protein CMC5_033300 [Chondromyces crocatus]
MQLKRSPKIFGEGVHRVATAEATFARVKPVGDRIGITRLADITGLDRIGIPVYSAIMPRSNDSVSVYNGKGARPIDAKVGAIMEAIERYAAWSARTPDVIGSYASLRTHRNVLDPRSIIATIEDDYTDSTEIAWLEGFDLFAQEPIWVPFYAAAYFETPADGRHLCYTVTSTNGLASGNTLEEAICHALCEIIERDAWTLAELLSRSMPRYLATSSPGLSFGTEDDLESYPSVDLATLGGVPRDLLGLYDAAGLRPVIRNITSDTGIATILCTVCDDLHDQVSPAHAGIGTHPDATVALTRAMTEAAQCRAVDMQALREDISMADEQTDEARRHAKRVGKFEGPNFYHSDSKHPIRFTDVPSHPTDEVVADIDLMLDRLKACGMTKAIVVDFSSPDLAASVARVLVPGMETWAALKGRIGPRADKQMRQRVEAKRVEAAAKINSQRVLDALFGRLPRS